MGKKKRSLVCDPRRKKNKRIMGSIGRSCFGHGGSGPSFDWRFILLTNELTNQRTIQVPIRSLLGHRSQAPPEVRLVSGQRVAEFRDFIARHPDVFTVSISCFFLNIFLPFFFFLLLSPSATSVSSSSSSSIFGFIFPSKSNTFLLKFIIVLQKKMVQLFLLLYDDDDIDVSIFGSCFPSKSNTFDVNTFSLKFTVIFRQKKDCSTISATNSNQE